MKFRKWSDWSRARIGDGLFSWSLLECPGRCVIGVRVEFLWVVLVAVLDLTAWLPWLVSLGLEHLNTGAVQLGNSRVVGWLVDGGSRIEGHRYEGGLALRRERAVWGRTEHRDALAGDLAASPAGWES